MLHKTQFITNLKGHLQTQTYICSYTCVKCMFPKLFLSVRWPACLCFGNPCWSKLYSVPLSLPQWLSFQIEWSPRLSSPTNILSMDHHCTFSLAVTAELLYHRQELKVVALANLCSWVCHRLDAASRFCSKVLFAIQLLKQWNIWK